MKNEIDNGGPAFPMCGKYRHGENITHFYQLGMSLRDYFAAKAMQKIIREGASHSKDDMKIIARYSYEMADAMLEERNK